LLLCINADELITRFYYLCLATASTF